MGCFNVSNIRKYAQIRTDLDNWTTDQIYIQYQETLEGFKEWWDPISPDEAITFDDHFTEKEVLAHDLIDLARSAYDLFDITVPVEDSWLPDTLVYVNKDIDSDLVIPYVPHLNAAYHPEQLDFDVIQQLLPTYDYVRNVAEGKTQPISLYEGWEAVFTAAQRRVQNRLQLPIPL
jgi:hypothetical protein